MLTSDGHDRDQVGGRLHRANDRRDLYCFRARPVHDEDL